jgi:hypothetical protein
MSVINVREASIKTASSEIKTLTVSKKLVTQRLFRPLQADGNTWLKHRLMSRDV